MRRRASTSALVIGMLGLCAPPAFADFASDEAQNFSKTHERDPYEFWTPDLPG